MCGGAHVWMCVGTHVEVCVVYVRVHARTCRVLMYTPLFHIINCSSLFICLNHFSILFIEAGSLNSTQILLTWQLSLGFLPLPAEAGAISSLSCPPGIYMSSENLNSCPCTYPSSILTIESSPWPIDSDFNSALKNLENLSRSGFIFHLLDYLTWHSCAYSHNRQVGSN